MKELENINGRETPRPLSLLLRPALGAELCACLHLRAAIRAEFFCGKRLATFRTELATAHFRAAMWAGRDDILFEFISRDVIHRLGFFARIGDRGLYLN